MNDNPDLTYTNLMSMLVEVVDHLPDEDVKTHMMTLIFLMNKRLLATMERQAEALKARGL